MAKQCPICIENYNKSTRKCVTCMHCSFGACRSCAERVLLDSLDDPQCMNCNKQWNKDFIVDNFTKKFVNENLKSHRENQLFEKEKAMLPATQPVIEREIEKKRLMQESVEIRAQINKLKDQLRDTNDKVFRMRFDTPEDIMHNDRRQFTMRCTKDGCRGFLSTQYKCGICDSWTCPDCHEFKGAKDAEHTCNPETLETVKQLAKDTKACPKCAVPIFRIEGCYAKDTPILMWDGTTKMSQDIVVGDILVGDDGEKRNVMRTMTGDDDMYEVTQNNGVSYTVNSKHNLVLKFSGDRVISWYETTQSWAMRWFDHNDFKIKSKHVKVTKGVSKADALQELENFKSKIAFPCEIEIPVDTYMHLSTTERNNLMGFKAANINWPKNKVDVDPYLLGLWLGDGINNGVAFAANDKEILEYLLEWCEKNDAEMVHDAAYKFRVRSKGHTFGSLAIGHGASCNSCTGCSVKRNEICDTPLRSYGADIPSRFHIPNPLKAQLSKYNLVKNKHIPLEFIVNDRETRLKLLAGIIDTDGHLTKDKKRIVIRQSNHDLAHQIAFLARSLGFVVNTSIEEKTNISFPTTSEMKSYKDQIRINISGNLFEIPTILPRKQATKSDVTNRGLTTSITVSHVGKGRYYGWQLDGNRRFILPDMTVSRNCQQMFCTVCHTAFNWNTLKIETGRIHNPHYFEMRARLGLANEENQGGCVDGLPRYVDIERALGKAPKVSRKNIDTLTNYIRYMVHVNAVERRRFETNNIHNNLDLRVRYLQNDITDVQFKRLLQQREKALLKKQEVNQVLETLYNLSGDVLRKMMQEKKVNLKELEELMFHTNQGLCSIEQKYNCKLLRVEFAFE